MKKLLVLCLSVVCALGLFAQDREGLTTYQLKNGLTVYLWEDHDQPDVTGYVAVRAGAIDEPAEYTGLAHYLEHMLFKGTQRIGSIDWEKEKPLYDEIIRLYDEYSDTPADNTAKRDELTKKINEASMEAAKYATTEDFFNLLDGIGAEGVNAYTSYDMTCYHNHFPASQMQKWLTIFSDRLINPVFRTFQAELENVFEEYNMYQDNISSHVRQKVFAELYKGHPYERDVIGLPEHLKNPRLSKLIEFYNTWYVPNNMALIIVGDFDAESAKPFIEQTFGRLEPKALPERKHYEEVSFAGNPKKTYKIGYNPQVLWAYKGVAYDNEDVLPLHLCVRLLSNGMNTGLLDKISMDGIVSGASASLDIRRDQGRILISAVPYYDANQQTYESNAATEKIVFKEIDKIRNGQIEDWLIQSVKEEYKQSYALAFESSDSKIQSLISTFIYNTPLDDIFTEKDKFLALTKDDIVAIAKKYFNADHLTLQFEEGQAKKNKLAKPKIQPLDPPKGVVTEYSKEFNQIPSGEIKETYMDMNDVQVVNLDKNVNLHYTKNPKNNIFSLTLRYGVGTRQMPMLEYAVSMMNIAGTLKDNMDAQAFRRALSELGGRCAYGVSDSYLTIQIIGNDDNLEEICKLVNTQILMPKLDPKQFDMVKGAELSNRFMLAKYDGAQSSAMREYVIYGKESDFIKVVPFMDIYHMDLTQVNTTFLNATKYALDAHYVGTRSIEEVKNALPLQENVQSSTSPIFRERQTYDKPAIYFLPNSNVQQATVYFYFNGKEYDTKDEVLYDAFNQYFSGGFTGLVMDEVRTKRSMAYSASAAQVQGPRPGKKSYFMGYVGTQSDKVADAVDVFMELINNMPEYPERLESIKAALRQANMTNKPSFRGKSQAYDYWREMGYTEDPAKENMKRINELTFDDIVKFYKENVQNQPVSVIIMGDPKMVNQKQLKAKYGKITKLSSSKLFAPLDLDF